VPRLTLPPYQYTPFSLPRNHTRFTYLLSSSQRWNAWTTWLAPITSALALSGLPYTHAQHTLPLPRLAFDICERAGTRAHRTHLQARRTLPLRCATNTSLHNLYRFSPWLTEHFLPRNSWLLYTQFLLNAAFCDGAALRRVAFALLLRNAAFQLPLYSSHYGCAQHTL